MPRPHRIGTQETTPLAVRLTKEELADLDKLCGVIGRRYGENPPNRSRMVRVSVAIVSDLLDDPRVMQALDAALEVDSF